ncbi:MULTISPECIES: hypothetical protein [Acidiphilium]|uniref:Uncharacterized protein n=1 Tax=Acidiphilium rubrum TaxID=526 RepID=A0A8G2CQ42_ACIRU|nr:MULTISPECIES: hypothetical protein [Acidiphilium]MCW8309499.1 hypothetical protein [Acidiphilium sp. PA]SIR55425.1 hypothetical protein SAMN05421828_1537 [Acidiphilium rubrum]
MTNPTSPNRITKISLTLGSAVAVAGLVTALPAQAATSGSRCNGKTMSSKSSSKTGGAQTNHAAMSGKRTTSSNSATCSGK